jgi:hypothetical protein
MADTSRTPTPPAPASGSDVAWLRYKRLAAFLVRLRRKVSCSLDVRPQAQGQPSLAIDADEKSVRALDRALGGLSFRRFWRGFVVGGICVLIAEGLCALLGPYVVSSKEGLLPPRSDALIRTKDINEQAMQVLEHEFKPRTKGVFGNKRTYFEAKVDDSTTVRLTCEKSRKGLVMSVSQRVGSRMAGDMVSEAVEGTGVDSLVGDGGVSRVVGSTVSRTAAMQVEKGYRSNPVITVRTRVDGEDVELVNYCESSELHRKAFSALDADSVEPENGDHVRTGRTSRPPEPGDEQLYRSVVTRFVDAYLKGELKGDRDE